MESESINEIQNYLDSFNKEIQTGTGVQQKSATSQSSTPTLPADVPTSSSSTDGASKGHVSAYFVTSENSENGEQIQYQEYSAEESRV